VKRGAVAGVVLLLSGSVALASAHSAAVRTIHITIRHSHFIPDVVTVAHGERVRFVVRNTDPIDHEFIVGPQPVQLMHEYATDASHSGSSGAISVPLFSTRTTTYQFSATDPTFFACHLPGHWRYGMSGLVRFA
jgi:uncharacterized cupredoxin-like copper-binding protein